MSEQFQAYQIGKDDDGQRCTLTQLNDSDLMEGDVTVRVDYSTVDELFSDFARNVNEGGLFVETESPLAIDTPVSVQFKIPGSDEPVSGSGRVVRTQSDAATETPGMAIEFDELNTESRRRINELVRGLRIGHRA